MKKEFKATQDYTIASKGTGLLLEVARESAENGAVIQLWEPTGAQGQLWRLKEVKQGLYQVLSKPSGKCLDVIDAATGEKIGIVADVLTPPAHEVYVVKGEHEYMIPAVDEFLAETNVEGGYIKVRLIEGMRTDV